MNRPKITVLGLGGNSVFMEVEHFHRDGETLHCNSMHSEPGGKGYNQAVAAARLGAVVSFICAMGQDESAKLCVSFLENEGIRPIVQTVTEQPTACAFILTNALGDNRVTVCRGASDMLSAGFVYDSESVIAASDALLLNFECPRSANFAALELAKKHKVPVFVNPAPAVSGYEALLKEAFVITPNRHEALQMLHLAEDTTSAALPGEMLKAGFSRGVITLGADGAIVFDGPLHKHIPACVSEAADSTGAGDCFSAALSVCLAKGWDLESAAGYATRASALSVRKKYVMSSLPYETEL